MSYRNYLQSLSWKTRRIKAFERANFKCERCGGRAVDVHHLSYKNVGNERDEDLQALCKACHIKCHGDKIKQNVADEPFRLQIQCPMCPNTEIVVYVGDDSVGYCCESCGHTWDKSRKKHHTKKRRRKKTRPKTKQKKRQKDRKKKPSPCPHCKPGVPCLRHMR